MKNKREFIYGNAKKQDDYMSATYSNGRLESVDQYFTFEEKPNRVYMSNNEIVKIISKMDAYNKAEIVKDIIHSLINEKSEQGASGHDVKPLVEAIGAMIDIMKEEINNEVK